MRAIATFFLAALSAISPASADAPNSRYPLCTAQMPEAPVCRAAITSEDRIRIDTAVRQQGAPQRFSFHRDGTALTILADRTFFDDLPQQMPRLCCDLQDTMEIYSDRYWAARYRIANLDRAVIWVALAGQHDPYRQIDGNVFVGPRPDYDPGPVVVPFPWPDAPEDIEFQSATFDGPRTIRVKIPERCKSPRGDCVTVYMADGGKIYTVYNYIRHRQPPWMDRVAIIGIDNTGRAKNEPPGRRSPRNRELVKHLGAPDYDRFSAFVCNDVIAYVENTLLGSAQTAARRIVAGTSSGGSWAITMAKDHGEVFCGTIAISMGRGPRPFDFAAGPCTRMAFGAGYLEPRRLAVMQETAERSRRAGIPTFSHANWSGHSPNNAMDLFYRALDWHMRRPEE